MRCGIVNSETRAIIEIIEADPATDKAPAGHEIVALEDHATFGWLHSRKRGFVPSIALAEKMEAERIARENSPEAKTLRYIEQHCDAFLDSVEAARG
jgi:hypothetical protein